jgi:hypothetical protein
MDLLALIADLTPIRISSLEELVEPLEPPRGRIKEVRRCRNI